MTYDVNYLSNSGSANTISFTHRVSVSLDGQTGPKVLFIRVFGAQVEYISTQMVYHLLKVEGIQYFGVVVVVVLTTLIMLLQDNILRLLSSGTNSQKGSSPIKFNVLGISWNTRLICGFCLK